MLLAPLVLAFDAPSTLTMPSAGVIGAILAMALLSTALAYVIYFRLLERVGATNLLLVTFLIPATSIMLGVLLLGESLLAKHLVGLGAIVVGLSLIDGRLWRGP